MCNELVSTPQSRRHALSLTARFQDAGPDFISEHARVLILVIPNAFQSAPHLAGRRPGC